MQLILLVNLSCEDGNFQLLPYVFVIVWIREVYVFYQVEPQKETEVRKDLTEVNLIMEQPTGSVSRVEKKNIETQDIRKSLLPIHLKRDVEWGMWTEPSKIWKSHMERELDKHIQHSLSYH